MRRPLLILVLYAVALMPASLEAQFHDAQHRADFHSRGAGNVLPGRVATAVVFGNPATVPTVAFDIRYFRVPRAGAPYSLPPSDGFQPVVYGSETYRTLRSICPRGSKRLKELCCV